MKRSEKILIVTPDFVGPVRNGGVGTAMYWLARALAALGADVEVLFTGVVEAGTPELWAQRFRSECGFGFTELHGWMVANLPAEENRRFFPEAENVRTSHLVLQFLKHHPCAAVYFQDYLGHGLRTLQYKRAGLGFADTRCIVTLHSSQRWIREGMQQLPATLSEVELDFQERESAVLADALVAPSKHMRDWVVSRWGLEASRIEVVPYCFEAPPAPPPRAKVRFLGFTHLVFFGRLETRKGLHFVLQALARSAVLGNRIKRVTFLGKRASVGGRPSGEAIAAALAGKPFQVEIIDNLNAVEAWEWLRRQREILVVAPSTLDNLPFSIIELFARRLPFVTTSIGGIPEILGPANRQLMAPATAEGLTARLEHYVGAGELTIDYRTGYDAARANARNAAHLRAQLRVVPPPVPASSRWRGARRPLVSVVVPHFNGTAYLAMALATLERQTLTVPYEVIVVDDCSSDPQERRRFRTMARAADRSKFRFFDNGRNQGPGAARNRGAARALGKYLVFFDSDNEAEPEMLAKMLTAIEASGRDCLSCYSAVVPQEDRAAPRPLDPAGAALLYAPLGACLEAGFRYNIFGDTCSIWKRGVFDALGGFSEARVKFEDWELYVRAAVAGYEQGVIPEPIFRYRSQTDSYNTRDLDYPSRALILQAYADPRARRRFDTPTLCAVLLATIEKAGENANRAGGGSIYDFFAGVPDERLERYLQLDSVDLAGDRGLADVKAMRHCVERLRRGWGDRCPRIMIYGAGLHTKVLLATNPGLAAGVVGFLDQKRRGDFLGRPCLGPDEFSADKADVVLYSSRPHERQMYAGLAHHKVEHVLIYAPELPAAAATTPCAGAERRTTT